MPLVISQIKGRIGVLTLNNPRRRNALNNRLNAEMADALENFKTKKIRAVIIRAQKNAKVWSAGYDITELPRSYQDPLGYDNPLEKTLRAIQYYPGPVIAMIQGGVWGGACDLAITCDIAVGDPSCTFAITPVKIGLPYNATGIMHFISRVGLNLAKEMFFTANPVDAERAYHFGLLNHIVDPDKLEKFTFAMAENMCRNSGLAIAVIKEQFRIMSGAYPVTPDAFERIQGLRRRVYSSHDYQEGIKAFLDKRKPKFKGK